MIASEARAARIALGLSEDALAAQTNTTRGAVVAWESGRVKIPRNIAVDLAWRVAQKERIDALEASGLPECAWMTAFDAEPVPEKLSAQNAQLERFLEHGKTCDVCKAREAFVAERFPPMPPAPRHGWAAIAVPIAERVQRLPDWAQPAVFGAIVFTGYSLLKVVLFLPAIARSPVRGTLTAIGGTLLSASIGGTLGLFYGQYRRLRARSSSRSSAPTS
jgi:transcriptional regulator with XRE-family HTH domain